MHSTNRLSGGVLLGLLLAGSLLPYALAQEDVIGCGGFVRLSGDFANDEKPDLSPIRVKLYTLGGVFKSETECAPNGYYYLPIYEKGRYNVRLEGPPGWMFDSAEQEVSTEDDGPCMQGKDIDFKVVGFALAGQVRTEGSESGPAGVHLKLQSKSGGTFSTETGEGGVFTFKDAPHGTYTLTAHHQRYKFRRNSVEVVTSFGQSDVKETFDVIGYDVKGAVRWTQGAAASEVPVLLKPQGGSERPRDLLCKVSDTAREQGAWCSAVSGKDGSYVFEHVPLGLYHISVDKKDSQSSRFEFDRDSVSVAVEHSPVIVDEPLSLKQFVIGGKVLDFKGNGVAKATVSINGSPVAETDQSGSYSIKTSVGSYSITVSKENMLFDELKGYELSPQLRRIGSIQASKYSLCGKVNMEPGSPVQGHKVSIRSSKGGRQESLLTDSKGEFCVMLAPEEYVLSVFAGTGIIMTPSEKKVALADGPVLNAEFRQAALHVQGSIDCLESSCGDNIKITLIKDGQNVKSETLNGKSKFSFANIPAGPYTVTVEKKDWCWKSQSISVKVGTEDSSSLKFVQAGFLTNVEVPRSLPVKLVHQSGTKYDLNLQTGQTTLCIPRSGTFTIESDKCVRLSEKTFTAPSAKVLKFAVEEVSTDLMVEAKPRSDMQISFELQVQRSSGKKVETVKAEPKGNAYVATIWTKPGQVVDITPKVEGENLMFEPRSEVVKPSFENRCSSEKIRFTTKVGRMLKGKIEPPLSNVIVRVVEEVRGGGAQEHEIARAVTGDDGQYSIGPVWDEKKYTVIATKEGYNFKLESNGVFRSVRMGEVKVKVVDTRGSQLAGVMLSLTGENEYRQNNRTGDDGTFYFVGLLPGNYFLRPMLKEYQFKPASQSVKVQEGENPIVQVQGERVAFSALGTVRLLDGMHEKNAVVKAEAMDDSQGYEETVSDEEGNFRLRGLRPGVEYKISIKNGEGMRHERCSPSHVVIKMEKKDVSGLDFIAFRRPAKLDLMGVVPGAEDSHLKQIVIELALASNPNAPIKSSPLLAGRYFEFASLARDSYVVRAVSQLDSRAYKVSSPPVTVDLDDSTGLVELSFRADPRNSGEGVKATSFYVLVLIVAGIVLATNRKELTSMYNRGSSAK